MLWFAAVAAAAVIAWLSTAGRTAAENAGFAVSEFFAYVGCIVAVFVRLPVLFHELGHLLFGLIAGMKPVSFIFSPFSRADYAGAVEMYPKGEKRLRMRVCLFAFGGTALALIVGGALFALYFALPYHAGLLFCGMLAPFFAYEGLRALLPAELPAGKTDGAVLWGLLRRNAEEELMLRVMAARGILAEGSYGDIRRELLFETPVVREDLPLFAALLQLRWRFLRYRGDVAAAREIARLGAIAEEFAEPLQAQICCDLVYYYSAAENSPARAAAYLPRIEEAKGAFRAIALAAFHKAAGSDWEKDRAEAERLLGGEKLAGERAFGEWILLSLNEKK